MLIVYHIFSPLSPRPVSLRKQICFPTIISNPQKRISHRAGRRRSRPLRHSPFISIFLFSFIFILTLFSFFFLFPISCLHLPCVLFVSSLYLACIFLVSCLCLACIFLVSCSCLRFACSILTLSLRYPFAILARFFLLLFIAKAAAACYNLDHKGRCVT